MNHENLIYNLETDKEIFKNSLGMLGKDEADVSREARTTEDDDDNGDSYGDDEINRMYTYTYTNLFKFINMFSDTSSSKYTHPKDKTV